MLGVIENLKAAYHLTPYQSKRCNQFFAAIKPGDFIYPGHLKSKLCLKDIKTAYFFMEELKKMEFVQNLYEVYCMECGRSKGIFLDALTEFKEFFTCDFCNKELSASEDIIVLYKVLKL